MSSRFGSPVGIEGEKIKPKEKPIDRALAIIEHVLAGRGGVAVSTLAVELGLPLPTAARLVGQLETRGIVRRTLETRRLSPGPRLFELGFEASRAVFTSDAAHLLLIALAAKVGEHCQIGKVSGTDVVYLDSVRGARGQALQFELGEHLPIHCTSTGKLFLAELDEPLLTRFVGRGPLRRFTPSTITDPMALLSEVRKVRRRGWAATDSEYAPGVVGCAVPIRGRDGSMLASLAIAVPAARTNWSSMEGFIPTLREYAEAIASSVGESSGAVGTGARGGAKQAPSTPPPRPRRIAASGAASATGAA